MTGRTIRRRHAARRDDIGELLTRRPLPGPAVEQVDPFLFLNHHGPQVYPPGNQGLPFGPHPHRGFETVTFIVEGELAHLDTAGHESVIRAGGVQWMTAGSGLVHAELSPQEFKRRGGGLEILQLWVNLPARLKMTAPAYVGLQRDAIPVLPTADGLGRVNLIAGRWGGAAGPVRSLTGVFMSTVELAAAGSRSPTSAGATSFSTSCAVRSMSAASRRRPTRWSSSTTRVIGSTSAPSTTPCCCSVTRSRSASPSSLTARS